MPESKEAITLYLAPWQQRMLRDFLPQGEYGGKRPREIVKMYVSLGKIVCPASYKIPARGIRKGDWVMYLTDEQMTMAREVMGSKVAIPAVNVTTELIHSGAVAFG